MAISYGGNTYATVTPEKMTPGEIDAVERVTGLTLQKIRRMGDTCVCEHGSRAHMHKDDAGEVVTDDTSCTSCDCDQHESDVPTRVTTAFMWVSVKRGVPTLSFNDFSETPLDDLYQADDEPDEADPTEPPHAEA